MSTTAAVIYALLSIAAVIAVLWGSFWLRDNLCYLINDDNTAPGWVLVFYLPYLVMWLWCFILEMIFVIFTLWLGYQAAKDFRDWWHKGAK